ncbi:MAG: hypothetical protein U9O94_06125 [Nanoarchaeota archaeon]|nr:hypothetical protein [Nanoarchaeota archaeon]
MKHSSMIKELHRMAVILDEECSFPNSLHDTADLLQKLSEWHPVEYYAIVHDKYYHVCSNDRQYIAQYKDNTNKHGSGFYITDDTKVYPTHMKELCEFPKGGTLET